MADRPGEDIVFSQTVTLTLDDDKKVECEILTILEANGQEYIALSPLDGVDEDEDGEVWLYRFYKDPLGGTDHRLENIEEDEEYEDAAEAFDDWLDEQTYGDIDWKE